MTATVHSPVAVLMASRPKAPELLCRAVSTVARQSHLPSRVVIVFDRTFPDVDTLRQVEMDCSVLSLMTLRNSGHPGAAGAWNTGLRWLQQAGFEGYVAILDDDDEWDPGHLECCLAASASGSADVVISGLRVLRDGVELPRAPLMSASRDDFLAGNPGWQGSNTFARHSTLWRVGGFTEGMTSTNDRDLAVRLLGLPDVTTAFTGRMTATWHIRTGSDALSRPGSAEKREGLLQFYAAHQGLMSPDIKAQFMKRAKEVFGVDVEGGQV